MNSHRITVKPRRDGRFSVVYPVRVIPGRMTVQATAVFASQEDAEHFAAGVQTGIVAMGGLAQVEIVEASDKSSTPPLRPA